MNYLAEVNRKTLLQLAVIRKDESKLRKQIRDIELWQLQLQTPKNFDNQDPENLVIQREKSFENICATLEDLGVTNPKRLTVFEFYSRLEYYKKKKASGRPQGANQK